MQLLAKVPAFAIAAAFALSGCGGGGTSPQPVTPSGSTPASASHTVVGTARLTLALPHVVTAKGSKSAVRAIPHGAARALPRGVARSPQYVNSSPNPGTPPCNGNVLDIYVDGVLLPAIDNGPESPDSLCVVSSPDGTQTVTIPLYSVNTSQIVAVEWDSVFQYVLAIGETDYGPFTPGTPVNLSLTMLMNASYIGITDLGFNFPAVMTGGTYFDLPAGSCPSVQQFGVFTADSDGTFVPVAGYGGTSTPTVSGTPTGGTTSLANSAIPGIYNVAWDGSCDALNLTASAQNPAYPIYTDVISNSGGVYPGIYHLYYFDVPSGNGQSFQNWFSNQLNYNPVTGTVQLEENGG